MMKKLLSSFGVLLFCTAMLSQSALAQVKYTNQTADMRKGPAAYHEFLLRLYINNKVELDSTQGYWDRIWFKETLGWVPSYTLSDTKISEDKLQSDSLQSRMNLMFSQIDGEETDIEEELVASPTQVSAAVKGFAEKWRRARDIEYTVDFEKFQIDPASPTEFQNFIGVRERKMNPLQERRLLYPDAIFVPYTDPAIDQVGYAVASAVAQRGLVSNYQLQRYLDLLSGLIVENSHKPELDFKVFILDSEAIQGYSLPGNYIFISKGALKQMRSEAELVHFLAHEIAHLVFSHGMVEYKEQEPRVKRESLLDEMRRKLAEEGAEDQATEEERENEQRITDWTDGFYDAANSERLESYEFEADYWGVIYTYLSGYNPNEAIKYLNRIQNYETEAITAWTGLSPESRIEAINEQIDNLNLGNGNTSSDLFQRLINSLE
ncbi:M48 family metallopeptidase [Gracilimonas sp. BCB1]|uniref:M48 family metallopeptidase n=1 Tax=Gracilimonas sp. BCB1 TaxID=3152362 RepID=UPI0032D8DCD8